MDELDRHLKDLAEVAKQHPPESRGRILAVTRLLSAIERSGKLYCQGRHDYPQEVYHDAMQEVRAYIFRLINRYDPSGAQMMTLVNQKLNHQFKDAIKKFKKEHPQDVSLAQEIGGNDEDSNKTLENILCSKEKIYLSDQVRQVIEEDPEDVFQGKFIKGEPEANFRAIAIYLSDQVRQVIEEDPEDVFQGKFIKGEPEANFRAIALHILDHYSMRELAKLWDIPEQTLYSFFRRCCQTFKPVITKHLRET